MNFGKIYLVAFLVLFLCTLESDGFILGLLLRVIALKGALFIGTPIALGSFLIGQGVGLLAGKLLGGYVVLKAAQRFHEYERAKWVKPVPTYAYSKPKPAVSYGVDDYDSGYHPTKGYSSHGFNYEKGYDDYHGHGHQHGHGVDTYGLGYSKGLLIGSSLKGFKAGFKKPVYTHGHAHGYSHGPVHGYGHVSPEYGYEPPVHEHYHHHHSLGDPGQGYSYGPSHPPQYNKRDGPSLISKLMTFPRIFGGKPKPKLPAYGEQFHPNSGYVPEGYSSPPKLQPHAPYYPGLVKEYDGPGKEFTGVISEPEKYPPGGYSVLQGHPLDDVVALSIHEPPDYSGQGGYTPSKYIAPSYDGRDKPKSQPMGLGYFNDDYEPAPGLASEDLVQVFGPSFPSKPNAYGGGQPTAEPMGPYEWEAHSQSPNYKQAQPEPLDLQASLAYDLSSEFNPIATQQHQSASSLASSKALAPNLILEKFLEEKLNQKARVSKREEEKEEARNLIKLLRQAYLKQLVESLNDGKTSSEKDGGVPEFKPLPNIPNATTEPPTPFPATESSSQIPSTATASGILGSTSDKMGLVHISSLSRRRGDEGDLEGRPKRQSQISQTTETPNTESEIPPVMDKEAQQKFVANFIEDVKSFFVLVSALDQDTCLQKLVCDVHTRVDQPDLTPYETNIVSTFRIMDTLMPGDVEDSSTNYRRAARIGEIGGSSDICQKSYSNCAYTASQIINLGQQVENGGPASDSSNLNPITLTMSNFETPTAMPRV